MIELAVEELKPKPAPKPRKTRKKKVRDFVDGVLVPPDPQPKKPVVSEGGDIFTRLVGLFTTPPEGTERMVLLAGRLYRLVHGHPELTQVKDSGESSWREPNDKDRKSLETLFG